MKEISVQELKEMQDSSSEFQLIDVREDYEIEICTLGGTHIPMGQITERSSQVRKDVPVVVHCRSGKRSAAVISHLETALGYDNLMNLGGGILAYAEQIDPTLEQY
jgi:rhodanese-related sulfurtransferase